MTDRERYLQRALVYACAAEQLAAFECHGDAQARATLDAIASELRETARKWTKETATGL